MQSTTHPLDCSHDCSPRFNPMRSRLPHSFDCTCTIDGSHDCCLPSPDELTIPQHLAQHRIFSLPSMPPEVASTPAIRLSQSQRCQVTRPGCPQRLRVCPQTPLGWRRVAMEAQRSGQFVRGQRDVQSTGTAAACVGACPYEGQDLLPAFISSWNTSCGTSTLPSRRMRFFPSFCFSSSFRFLPATAERHAALGGWAGQRGRHASINCTSMAHSFCGRAGGRQACGGSSRGFRPPTGRLARPKRSSRRCFGPQRSARAGRRCPSLVPAACRRSTPADVATVALGEHVFAVRAQRLARHHAPPSLRLQHNLELLAVHQVLQGGGWVGWRGGMCACGGECVCASVGV